MLETLVAKSVYIARITLHVGLGTFAPLRVEKLDDVRLHRERYTISAETAEAVNRAFREGRRIVAVGTTVVRTLERDGDIHLAGIRISARGWAVDQLPSAPIEPADAGERLCRAGTGAGRLSTRSPTAVRVLQLWRLHVHWLIAAA
jgi:hypothetical protein